MDNTVFSPSEGSKVGQGMGMVAPQGPNCWQMVLMASA